MRHTEPDQPGLSDLLRENEDLRRQIQALKTAGNVRFPCRATGPGVAPFGHYDLVDFSGGRGPVRGGIHLRV